MFYYGMCRSHDGFVKHRGFGYGRFAAERWAGGFGRGGGRFGGRMFGQGDLRLVLLALIGKKPVTATSSSAPSRRNSAASMRRAPALSIRR